MREVKRRLKKPGLRAGTGGGGMTVGVPGSAGAEGVVNAEAGSASAGGGMVSSVMAWSPLGGGLRCIIFRAGRAPQGFSEPGGGKRVGGFAGCGAEVVV